MVPNPILTSLLQSNILIGVFFIILNQFYGLAWKKIDIYLDEAEFLAWTSVYNLALEKYSS